MNRASDNSRKKVLLVDDNEILLQAVAAKLERAGCEPFVAFDGGEAADVALRENLDLIIVDTNFAPDIYGVAWDGYQIIERLAQLDSLRHVPVIAIAGKEDDSERERAQKSGVVAFFHKPMMHADLLKLIQDTLRLVPAG